jgi:hypothetical protein
VGRRSGRHPRWTKSDDLEGEAATGTACVDLDGERDGDLGGGDDLDGERDGDLGGGDDLDGERDSNLGGGEDVGEADCSEENPDITPPVGVDSPTAMMMANTLAMVT